MTRSMDQTVSICGAAAVGAGLMYLLDPDRGTRRRALTIDKARRAATRTTRGMGTSGGTSATAARVWSSRCGMRSDACLQTTVSSKHASARNLACWWNILAPSRSWSVTDMSPCAGRCLSRRYPGVCPLSGAPPASNPWTTNWKVIRAPTEFLRCKDARRGLCIDSSSSKGIGLRPPGSLRVPPVDPSSSMESPERTPAACWEAWLEPR